MNNFLDNSIYHCLLNPDQIGSATFKSEPSDFIVEEDLGFLPTGEGEHLFLKIKKENANTQWVAKALAKFYQVPLKDVSYSGLKDRNAVTTQYFSVWLPLNKTMDYPVDDPSFSIIEAARHRKKLKRGTHRSNQFRITLRDVNIDKFFLEKQVDLIQKNGMPNFFDTQRFGIDNHNTESLMAWSQEAIKPRKRNEKDRLLSTMRSLVFNKLLAIRIEDSSWNQIQSGDILQLEGKRSVFQVQDEEIDSLRTRLTSFDIHPTGLLLGELCEDSLITKSEKQAVKPYYDQFFNIIKAHRLNCDRRPLRVKVSNLTYFF